MRQRKVTVTVEVTEVQHSDIGHELRDVLGPERMEIALRAIQRQLDNMATKNASWQLDWQIRKDRDELGWEKLPEKK